jgi:hypothetical protein
MVSKHLPRSLAILQLLFVFCLPSYGDDARQQSAGLVTITPELTSAILANPGMGWETFHRSNRHDGNLS